MRTNAKLTALLVAILFTLLVNLALLGAVLFFQLRRPPTPVLASPPSSALTAPVLATAPAVTRQPAPAEQLAWHDAPVVAAVGGDDTEDIVGGFSTTSDDGRISYFVGAFDGATLVSLWRAGPLATVEPGERAPILQLAGGRVFAAESNEIHIYDLANGDEAKTLHTSDRVTDLCVIAPDRVRLWAKVADGKSVEIDAADEARPRETAPAGCAAPHSKPPKVDAPAVAGFNGAKVYVDADVAVAAGVKSPGTPVPTVIGFDPKSKKVRWQHPLCDASDPTGVTQTAGRIFELVDGHIFATCRLQESGWHFTSIDAKSGDRAWDVAVPDGRASAGTITVSDTRVYLVHGTLLDVYEKATGRPIGTLGGYAR